MPTPFAALDSILSEAVNGTFGETFEFRAFKATGDVNAPKIPDPDRPPFRAVGVWNAQTKSKAPTARGALQDDNAHNWTASMPEVHVDDALLIWKPQPGDRVLRIETMQAYAISVPPRPDGMGHTCMQLTSRQITA